MELSKTFRFEASHILPNYVGKCGRLHGHSWVLTVFVEGNIDPSTGMVMDYTDLGKRVQPIVDDLDHRHLGCWPDGSNAFFHASPGVWLIKGKDWSVSWLETDNPTSENLLLEIGRRLGKVLNWSRISLNETCRTSCSLTWDECVSYWGKRFK